MYDAHCHVSHELFNADRHEVIARAKKKLVAIVEAGGNLEQNERALGLKHSHGGFVHAVIGLAPHYVNVADLPSEMEMIKRNADDILAIGEIGLEYHYFKEAADQLRQREAFREQLILAEKLQLPVVIHCREAWYDLLAMLKDFPQQKVMLHFFNKPEHLTEALRRGYWISIATLKSKDLDRIIKDAPLNNLLAETDSPYLWTGGRNEPANVVSVYERIAGIKDILLPQVQMALMANASKFFETPF
ncbi:MAG: TatD family hydrolase [Candidatus Micrarchaeota archaeon]